MAASVSDHADISTVTGAGALFVDNGGYLHYWCSLKRIWLIRLAQNPLFGGARPNEQDWTTHIYHIRYAYQGVAQHDNIP